MPKGTTTDKTKFQKLLGWISDSEDQAGEAYEKIRLRLIKIFCARGCRNAEELADETIERVTGKIDSLLDNYEGDPRLYFYGVAKNVFREHLRKPVTNELPVNLTQNSENTDEKEKHDRCLTICLDKLGDDERVFILDYYKGEKTAKIENRQKIMERLELTPQALRVKAFRIRSRIQECVFGCLGIQTA